MYVELGIVSRIVSWSTKITKLTWTKTITTSITTAPVVAQSVKPALPLPLLLPPST